RDGSDDPDPALRRCRCRRVPWMPTGEGAREEGVMDWKIELIFVPVTDVDRSKAFYEKVGFHAEWDQTPVEGLRFVQMTPPGSACSIAFGTGLGIDLEPGKQNTIQVVIPDADE